jgi:hypothetical protein
LYEGEKMQQELKKKHRLLILATRTKGTFFISSISSPPTKIYGFEQITCSFGLNGTIMEQRNI